MQVNELKEQLAGPSHRLFVEDGAGIDLSREVGLSVGNMIFQEDDPNQIIEGIMNMEAYFYHLRSAALSGLKAQLARRYNALTAITLDESNTVAVQLGDDQTLALPGHTAPALNELVARLEPTEGSDNPRLCLELIQQTARLMQVMGMTKLVLRETTS